MKKILLYLLLLPSLGFGQSLYEYQNLSKYRVRVGELVLNGEKIRPVASDSGQVLQFDGTHWKNTTKNGESDPFYKIDSLALNRSMRAFVRDSGNYVWWKDTTQTTGAGIASRFDNSLKQNLLVNSAGLAGAISDETGTLKAVFSNEPTFTSKITIDGNVIINTNGTSALLSTKKANNTDGFNVFFGGGGQSVIYDGVNSFSGSYNTANGFNALYSNTTGQQNTANGVNALYSNTTGSYNTANGVNSGRWITGFVTANTTSDYCVFIGDSTSAKADNDQNEIVIGHSAVGNGSNTATYGNSKITNHVFTAGELDAVTAKFGTSVNNLELEPDGTLKFNGTATVFDDILMPFEQGKSGVNNIPAFNSDSIYYTFTTDTTGVNACAIYMTIQLPHSYKEGSTIYPHIHYKHETAVGTPNFKVKYKWINYGATTSVAWKWYPMTTTTGTTNNTHQMMYGAGISGTGKTISSLLLCKIYLGGTPTNVHAYQFDVHFEKDTNGSRTETSK